MWTLLFLFGLNASNGQVIQMPYFETREACINAGELLLKTANKRTDSYVFYKPQVLCVPSR